MKQLSLITRAVSVILLANASFAVAQQITPTSVNKPIHRLNPTTNSIKNQVNGKQTYIIQLHEPSVAQYNGGIHGYSATNPKSRQQTSRLATANHGKLDASASHVTAYREYLQQRQQAVLGKISQITGQATAKRQLQFAINGMVLELTSSQAERVRSLTGVKSVEADRKLKLSSDTSPELTGATGVWAGATLAGTSALGEGTVVAIFDTGINTDHPSFAATGGDGYTHTNPLGSGNYLGDCAGSYAALCNDKLIGVYSYAQITNQYADTDVFPPGLPRNGEDYNGHGSHVAGTAAGNILYDVPSVGLAYDVEESDGYAGEFAFAQISGIAPHANIISFQVCLPGENDDEYNGCYANLAVTAIDDAIASGVVDAINYSISGGDEVWGNTLSEAWLSANNAGIFVAHSAGNDGPDAATSDKLSPWLTPVAATTHGRTLDLTKTIGSFTGGSGAPSTISGESNTGAITADIVYAGDFPNPNDPGGDSAQCLQPYPTGTFNGEIVVCDRGDIARIQKAINVAQGGAGGYVLANLANGAENLVADEYVIPGIHIAASDGNRLKTWLASGSNHRATITATAGIRSVDSTLADKVASFSSRGPNTQFSTLLPMISAPGVDIYSAYSDEHYGHETTGPAPADYAYLDGTSMASPHVAGAALLLRELHPDWSADAIRSALMMTAETDIGISGSADQANWLDMGAGRIQIDAAANAGLIMEETQANYEAANPASGGEPKTLNIPALVDNNCLIECTWQRTFTATRNGTWTFSLDDMDSGLALDAQPASMTLSAGQSQTVTFTLSTWNVADNDWVFGDVLISGNDNNPQHMPIAVVASNGNFPNFVERTSYRSADSAVLEDLLAIEITNFTYEVTGLTLGTKVSGNLAQDSDPSDFYDNPNDGVYSLDVVIEEGTPRLVAQTTASTAPDLDLYIAYDNDNDGIFDEDELLALSAGYSWNEYISIESPPAGSYRIYVHNFTGSTQQQDSFTLDYAVVGSSNDGSLSIDAPPSVALRESFDMRLLWSLDSSIPGDRYYASVALGSSAQTPDNLGIIPVDIIRGENDVQLAVNGSDRVSPGETVDYTVDVLANTSAEDRNYEIDVTIPDGASVVAGSVTDGGVVNGDTISWSITQNITASASGYTVTTPQSDGQCRVDTHSNNGYIDLTALGYQPLQSSDGELLAAFPVSVNVLGEHWNGISVSSKGFVTPASATVNTFPAINRMLADGTYRGAILAPLWRNWTLNNAAGSGITVATIHNGSATVIEWKGLQSAGYSADMQVILNHDSQPGEPAVIYAYQNVRSGSESLAGTVGWQNSNGKRGATLAFNSANTNNPGGDVESLIQSGTVLCLTPQVSTTATGPAALDFSLQIDADAQLTGSLPVSVSSQVPNIPGTQEEIGEVNTEVQMHAAPELLIAGSEQASISLTELQASVLPLTVTDANGDNVNLSVEQLSGPAASINVAGEVITITPASVSAGTALSLRVTATDEYGFTDTATVDITVTPNQPPVLTVSAPSSVQEGATITIRASATDPEDDDIIFTINGVQGSTFSSTAPDTNETTTVSFTVTATDGQNTVSETVTVTVNNRPSGGGGSLSLVWLGGLLIALFSRRKKRLG